MKDLLIKKMILIIILILIWGCKDNAVSVEDQKYPLASENGIDAKKLDEAYQKAENFTGIKALLVARNGNLISEGYYDFEAEQLKEVRSVTKSVLSTLIGIALHEGFIPDIEQTIEPYFREYIDSTDNLRNSITVRDLLTMSCGLAPDEFSSINSPDYMYWYNSNDRIKDYLDQPFASQPGEKFRYFSGGTHLLSAILTKASGMTTLEFARKYLFDPMEVDTVNWRFLANRDNPEIGYYHGGAGLEIRPRDMIKFGELFLNDGVYKGKQIVPPDWVAESTKMQISPEGIMPWGPGYGYLWWLGNQSSYNYFFANGWGGQIIMCVPKYNLVIVAAHNWGGLTGTQASQQWMTIMDLIMNDILSAVH